MICDIIKQTKFFIMNLLKRIIFYTFTFVAMFIPLNAFAEWKIVEKLDVSPLIPIVLSSFMQVAINGYNYFINNGKGIIFILIWGFLAFTIAAYLLKMFFPSFWLSFLGFSGGGKIDTPETITKNILKPAIRTIIAATIFILPITSPKSLTEYLVNPFLEIGSFYTSEIIKAVPSLTGFSINIPDSESEIDSHCMRIVEQGWISENSCRFLTEPVKTISFANNKIIQRGFDFISNGLRGLLTVFVHGGGESILNILSGVLLVFTFVSCNIFMALLIIQAIFNFGIALILYPFKMLAWVVKKSDDWVNLWPAFDGIIKALREIIITMIACAFILCINIAVIQALFQWNATTFFSAASGGVAHSNVPTSISASMSFGDHSMLWLSALLTYFLMVQIFDITRKKILDYTGSGMDALYNKVSKDAKTGWGKIKALPEKIKKVTGWGKK